MLPGRVVVPFSVRTRVLRISRNGHIIKCNCAAFMPYQHRSLSGNRVSGWHAIRINEPNKMQKNTPNLAAGYGVTLGWSIILPIPKLAAGYGVALAEKDNGLGTEFSDTLI